MAIRNETVKELRERTGAGILDCKEALSETDGDMDEAVDYLEREGIAAAKNKAGRIAAEGLVDTWIDADRQEALIDAVARMGLSVTDPTMTLAFLALPVIPDLKLCDTGLTRFNADSHPVPQRIEG